MIMNSVAGNAMDQSNDGQVKNTAEHIDMCMCMCMAMPITT